MLLVVILKHLRLLSLLLVDLLHIKHRKHSLSSGSTCLLAQPLCCVSPWRTASVEISFSLLKKKKKIQLLLSLYLCNCKCAIPVAPHPPIQEEQWWQLTSTMCDVPHVEFSSQEEFKPSHMRATSSGRQRWTGVDVVNRGRPWSQLPRNLLPFTTSHIHIIYNTSSCGWNEQDYI